MIEIKKGSQVLKVSKCTYNDMFKKLGYEIVGENSTEEIKQISSVEPTKIDDNLEQKMIEEEAKQAQTIEEELSKSSDLNVNVIGEKIENFELKEEEGEEETSFEKLLKEKTNNSKRK